MREQRNTAHNNGRKYEDMHIKLQCCGGVGEKQKTEKLGDAVNGNNDPIREQQLLHPAG